MCGIAGVLCAQNEAAVGVLYEALLALQHRGQDAAGIVTEDGGRFCLQKNNGMVRDVFDQSVISNLRGECGIGHVRYPTAGSSCSSEAQPFYVNSPFGISLAHNGNLINASVLQTELLQEWRHINTGSDSEVLLNVLASELLASMTDRLSAGALPDKGSPHAMPEKGKGSGSPPNERQGHGLNARALAAAFPTRANEHDLIAAVRALMNRAKGGFAVTAMVCGWGLLAFRDPNGIRPLVYGSRVAQGHEGYVEYMVASESGALNACGFELIGDVPPGHCLSLAKGCAPTMHNVMPLGAAPTHAPCVFEYVYFARPDSVLDGVSVYRTRLRMGEKLAHKIATEWPDHDIDVVIPVPDTARTAALECASTLGIKYREGFLKNRYVGRTFIMPAQGLRKKSVRQKLAPIASEFAQRNVLLVDDSIVRGTTSAAIIQMAREAGARRVYMASAAPPVVHPNVYGIDMPTKDELVAHRQPTIDGIAKEIHADRVIYQNLSDLISSITEEAAVSGSSLKQLDCSCFDGKYVTSDDAKQGMDIYLTKLASDRRADRGGPTKNSANALDRLEIPVN